MLKRSLVALLCVSVIMCASACCHALPSYQLRWIETPSGFSNSSILAMNNRGECAGLASDQWFHGQRAFFWAADGTPTEMGPECEISGMNDSGVVVGTSFTGPADHGFAWGNGTWIDLWATSPDRWSGSRGVNDSGVIVGWGVGDTGQVVGCKWTTGAQAELLPNLAGIYGSAEDIDQSGRITGWSMDGQDMDRPCICNTDGTIQGLDVLLGSSWGRGFHMNNVGQVVGYCGGSYPYRATVWNADGSMVELKHDGWNYIEATGINDAGQVVGYALDQSGQEHGFIYTPETGVVDLSLVGASGFTASSINNDGVIAGSCRLPDRMQACLLVPVPEPSSLFAVLSLLAPFCVAAVRRAR